MMSYNALGHRAQLTVGMHRNQPNVLTAGARRLNDSIDEALQLFCLCVCVCFIRMLVFSLAK